MVRPVNRIDLIKKAEFQLKSENYDEALGNITQCLDFFPAFSPAKVLLAEVYFRKGNLDFAIKELSSIISDTPDNLRARKLIIEVLVSFGNKEEAKSHLNFLEFVLPEDDSDFIRLKELLNKSNAENIEKDDRDLLKFETKAHLQEDEVTEVFDEGSFVEKLETSESIDQSLFDDSSDKEIVTVTLDKKVEEDSGIKTMTLASIYEKQGMLAESLDILEKLYVENESREVLNEIKRLKFVMDGSSSVSMSQLKIEKLKNWLGVIHAVK